MAYNDPSDQNLDDELDPNQDGSGQVTLNRAQIRAMERDAKQARTLLRENALLKAGIDTGTPLGALFLNAYEGDLAPEAVKTAWQAVAPPAAPAPDPEATDPDPTPDPAAQDFERERQRLATGGAADDGQEPDRDPRKVAVEEGQKMMKEGSSREVALASAFSTLVSAAASGDQRVIIG